MFYLCCGLKQAAYYFLALAEITNLNNSGLKQLTQSYFIILLIRKLELVRNLFNSSKTFCSTSVCSRIYSYFNSL